MIINEIYKDFPLNLFIHFVEALYLGLFKPDLNLSEILRMIS